MRPEILSFVVGVLRIEQRNQIFHIFVTSDIAEHESAAKVMETEGLEGEKYKV